MPTFPTSRRRFLAAASTLTVQPERPGSPSTVARSLKVGIIGLDSYQAVDFTRLMNAPGASGDLAGIRVVAAFPGGSPDIAESRTNLPKWIEQIRPLGVEVVDTPRAVIDRVDAVMVMSVDGRAHLREAGPALRAQKPTYVGRPLAASLEDAVRLFRLADAEKAPLFSCSQHRFNPGFADMRHHEEVGEVLGCDVYGGCPLEPSHPDLFWHGVHGVETLFTIMGPGCETVARVQSGVTEHVTGTWKDGRVGTYRGIHQGAIQYQAMVFGSKGILQSGKYGGYAPVRGVVPQGPYAAYEPLARQIARFWKSRVPPVSKDETLEIFAFMDAADVSERRKGAPVRLAEVLDRAGRRAARG
jgi:predicted dehydrogenase